MRLICNIREQWYLPIAPHFVTVPPPPQAASAHRIPGPTVRRNPFAAPLFPIGTRRRCWREWRSGSGCLSSGVAGQQAHGREQP